MSDPALDNLCLEVPAPPPTLRPTDRVTPRRRRKITTPAPVNTDPTLLDLVKLVDPMMRGKRFPALDLALDKIKPASDKVQWRNPAWTPDALTQAQNRLKRAVDLTPIPTYHLALDPSGPAGDLTTVRAMVRKYEEHISQHMVGQLRNERRRYPDFAAGLREAMERDCACESRYRIGFGVVIRNQRDEDPEMISNWIWGPRGEFTGYVAGDKAFDDTYHYRRGFRDGYVGPLDEFQHLKVQFRFTPRVTEYERYKNPYAMDWDVGRDRTGPFMVQFASYEDQAEWGRIAAEAGMQQLRDQGPQRHDY